MMEEKKTGTLKRKRGEKRYLVSVFTYKRVA